MLPHLCLSLANLVHLTMAKVQGYQYFDGGVTDYYLNMKIDGANGLLLGDLHPTSPIYRSALDLFVPWTPDDRQMNF
jgi:hypothetical protein